MPSGQAHLRIGIITTPLVVLGAWTVAGFPLLDMTSWLDIGIVTTGYVLNPYYLSPDASDLPESSPSRRWGCAAPILWPLQMIIHSGKTRNPLSHWPPLSSLLRMFTIWIMVFLVFLFGVGVIDLVWFGLYNEILIPFTVGKWFLLWCFIIKSPWWWRALWGVTIGDVIHLGADVGYSYMRK